tara:strand:- start:53 stop:241 length:189 start_codon:yes stop_codon:yes gene_type:complete
MIKRSKAMDKLPNITYSKAEKLLDSLESHIAIYWPGVTYYDEAIKDFKEQIHKELKERQSTK